MRIVPPEDVKGKTWGPSTLHQRRERGYLPALRPTPHNLVKSAPNLDKQRASASTSSSNGPLGKSEDGLDKLLLPDFASSINSIDEHDDEEDATSVDTVESKPSFSLDFGDSDDSADDVKRAGCFAFIRTDDSSSSYKNISKSKSRNPLLRVKKNSMDLDDRKFIFNDGIQVQQINRQKEQIMSANSSRRDKKIQFEQEQEAHILHDRIYHLQKSLDEIPTSPLFDLDFEDDISRKKFFSKSNDELSICGDDEEFIRGGSQFKREYFFTNIKAKPVDYYENNGTVDISDEDSSWPINGKC